MGVYHERKTEQSGGGEAPIPQFFWNQEIKKEE